MLSLQALIALRATVQRAWQIRLPVFYRVDQIRQSAAPGLRCGVHKLFVRRPKHQYSLPHLVVDRYVVAAPCPVLAQGSRAPVVPRHRLRALRRGAGGLAQPDQMFERPPPTYG
jgi:hypothetical protein